MKRFALGAFLMVLSSPAFAQPVFNPTNGHWYRSELTPATWADAKTHGVNSGGYLAVITDAAENTFVHDNFNLPDHWLGGNYLNSQWQWVNGDPWGYTAWSGGEPFVDGLALAMLNSGTWHGVPSIDALPYVIEHEAPLFPTQPIFNPSNGHYYQCVSTTATWPDANAAAVNLGGHLVVINDALENDFVRESFAGWSNPGVWIGGSLVNGQWQWVDGNPWGYASWAGGQPNNDGEALEMFPDGDWNDSPPSIVLPYVVEYNAQPLATRTSTLGGVKALYK